MRFVLSWTLALLMVSACSTPEQPKTSLLLTTNGKSVDTAAMLDELTGLLTLSAGPDAPSHSFSVTANGNGDTLALAIRPQLTDLHKRTLGTLLDTLVKNPSSWSPAPLTLFYTDNSPDVVELLGLDTVNGYPLEIDYASAEWAYKEEQTYMVGPMASGAAVSYLDYRLKKPLPSSSYSWGLDQSSGETSETADLVSSILSAVGPTSSSFTIRSADNAISPLWDSLRVNHRFEIDSLRLSLNWAYVEFPYREFSRHSDRDTMITSSIEKLRGAQPYVFHALVAPRLSAAITGYIWE